VAVPSRKVCKRHLELAAYSRFELMDRASETVWRKPLGVGGGIEDRSIYPLRRRLKNPMESHRSGLGLRF
jgi:hypothetical protein